MITNIPSNMQPQLTAILKQYEQNIEAIIQPQLTAILKQCEQNIEAILKRPVLINMVINVEGILTNELLKEMVCAEFGLDWITIVSRNKLTKIVTARQVYRYLCRVYLNDGLERIAAKINWHHSTVMQSIECIEKHLFIKDDYVCSFIKPILNKIKVLNEAQKIPN